MPGLTPVYGRSRCAGFSLERGLKPSEKARERASGEKNSLVRITTRHECRAYYRLRRRRVVNDPHACLGTREMCVTTGALPGAGRTAGPSAQKQS